jgi:hypothetical protein
MECQGTGTGTGTGTGIGIGTGTGKSSRKYTGYGGDEVFSFPQLLLPITVGESGLRCKASS